MQEALVDRLRDAAQPADIRYRRGVNRELLDTERQPFDAGLLLAPTQHDEFSVVVGPRRRLAVVASASPAPASVG